MCLFFLALFFSFIFFLINIDFPPSELKINKSFNVPVSESFGSHRVSFIDPIVNEQKLIDIYSYKRLRIRNCTLRIETSEKHG